MVFLRAAIETEDEELFLSYISWLKVLLHNYNVTSVEISENLRCVVEILNEKYERRVSALIIKYLEDAIELIPKMNLIVEEFIVENESDFELADRYLKLLNQLMMLCGLRIEVRVELFI